MDYSHIGPEIKRLGNEIHSTIDAYRAEAGDDLTMMQSWIIGYLYQQRDREMFQKDIEAKFSIARSTATGILQLMEKKGYIVRQTIESDARMKRLVLTEKGSQQRESTIHNIERMESKLREGISEEDLETFFRVIRKMRNNIEREHSETDRRRDQC